MKPEPSLLPRTQAALDHPPTAEAYRRLVLKRRLWMVSVLMLGLASGWMTTAQSPSKLMGFLMINVVVYPPCVFVAALALRRTKRVAGILGAYPWRQYPCSYPRRALESPKAIIITFHEGYAPILRISQYSGHLAQKQNLQPDTIWFAGDPRFGGVVSPVGGHFPVRVVPEAPAGPIPDGSPEDDALAERAGLITGGKVHTT